MNPRFSWESNEGDFLVSSTLSRPIDSALEPSLKKACRSVEPEKNIYFINERREISIKKLLFVSKRSEFTITSKIRGQESSLIY